MAESHFCLPAAATDGFLAPMTFRRFHSHEQEGTSEAISPQAEAVVARRPAQGVRCESDRVFLGRGVWRRNTRAGATARRNAASAVPLFSEQRRPDQGSLSHGVSRT